MQAPRKLQRADAFERALKGAFGEQTTLAKVEQARRLYARYRTDEMLERCRRLEERAAALYRCYAASAGSDWR